RGDHVCNARGSFATYGRWLAIYQRILIGGKQRALQGIAIVEKQVATVNSIFNLDLGSVNRRNMRIEKSVASSDDSHTLRAQSVGKSQAWRKVVLVIGNTSACRPQWIRNQPICAEALIVVSDSQIQRQASAHAQGVLKKSGKLV